ncbi:molybdopterin-dependent oxidoreductase [Nocardioides mesophilus]|uniref:Molybdopterin-dependent oxidoreductase n=1 Tax=Nocardioides mesophilus TaxID=433659 RepID=A0A7G9R9D8_9ACTN|nr:molybdopterin-dependent oxidoreductase [Nocardioides mesophilus]QNN52213.1 molybdopterin-dependent oxidoreductase [Nocardioides mesophilus]
MANRSGTVHGVCNLCEAICGLLLTVEDGRVSGVRGNPADPLSRGHVCPKALALPDLHEDPHRLRHPVRRTADGWQELGWDEALDLVADRLAGTARDHGRDAVGVYLGNPNVHSLGSMTHGTAMVRSLRTRNTYSATSVDQLPHQLVAHLLYGHQLLLPVPDLDRTSYFLVLGANPMASNGSLMTAPDFPNRVRELHARGGRMVVLDPRHTETARVADEHHFVRPGSDAFVLLALLHVILGEGGERPAPYVDGLDAVRRAVEPFTPERAESRSGLAASEVRRIAHELAAADAAAVYGRVGVSVQEFGLVSQWAVQVLNAVTGNLDRPGGVMLTRPAVDVVGRRLFGRGHHGLWRSRVRSLPEFSGELPVATLADEILTPGEGQVRTLVTVAGNPVSSTPGGDRLDRALAGLDFMVAVDVYVNETTRHADVILPPTTALERDHYDLVFHALAVRDTARFTPAVLPKPEGAMHDWEIYRELTLRTARRSAGRPPLRARLVRAARMRLSPTRTLDLLLRTGERRLSLRRLRAAPDGLDLGPLEPHLPERLQTPGKRIDLAQPLVLDDLARLEAAPAPDPDTLLLIGRRHQRDCNSWMHNAERLTRGRPRHQLLAHPDDLAARGLLDGSTVRVSSRVGSVEVEVSASTTMMPGVVSLPHGYGHRRAGVLMAGATALPGASINDLTDPERLDVSGNAVLNGTPVTLSAC